MVARVEISASVCMGKENNWVVLRVFTLVGKKRLRFGSVEDGDSILMLFELEGGEKVGGGGEIPMVAVVVVWSPESTIEEKGSCDLILIGKAW
ncbi:hypothetical protein GOBAR_DD33591 [Gossypium barbadense]|nr:hypothetical protein GOBAR_DD33591 [Gossypium barbadense]